MLKKRIIGVVTVKNGWAVQSFGYHRYLPLGKPECLVENLDRWGADEILVRVIDRSVNELGPDFELLEKLARLGLGTPLIYGGGICTAGQGVQVIRAGADRITLDSLLHHDLYMLKCLADQLGAQALIASLPMVMGENEPQWFNYESGISAPVGTLVEVLVEQKLVSEVLLTDSMNEGEPNGFDTRLVDLFPDQKVPLIVFGGISSIGQMDDLLAKPNVVAVSVGNFLNYHEHAIQYFKEGLASTYLRPSTYASELLLVYD